MANQLYSKIEQELNIGREKRRQEYVNKTTSSSSGAGKAGQPLVSQ